MNYCCHGKAVLYLSVCERARAWVLACVVARERRRVHAPACVESY